MASHPTSPHVQDIDLGRITSAVWRKKILIVTATVSATVISAVVAFTSTPWYKAEMLLAPGSESQSISLERQLGGLAALAGVGSSGGLSPEYLAMLESKDLAAEFIVSNELMPVFFTKDWNAESETWKEEAPELIRGIEFFHDEVLSITPNTQTGLVEVAVTWMQPETTVEWAEEIVARANEQLRLRTLEETQRNIDYLSNELASANLLPLQQSIGRLLEAELQKRMLAEGNTQFAFKVVDSARVPDRPSRPRKLLLLVAGTIFGFGAAVLLVASRELFQNK